MSSITHEATIKLNLDFVDSAGLNQLKRALKDIKDALDLTKFDDRVRVLEQDLAEAKAQVQELTQSLKEQAAAHNLVAQNIEKQTKKQKAAEAAARRVASVNRGTLAKFQGVNMGDYKWEGSVDAKGKLIGKYLGAPKGLAGDWRQAMTGMATSLKTMKTAMAGTEGIAGNLARGMATIGRATADAAKKTQSADDAFKELGNAIANSKGKGKQYEDQMKQIKAQYAALEGQEDKNIATINRLIQKVKEIKSAEQQHQQSMKDSLMYRLSYYEKQVDAVYRASYRLSMTGSNLMQFGRRVIDMGRNFMDTFGEYQFALNRAAGAVEIWEGATIDGVDGTELLSERVLDLAEGMKIIPAQEVAEAFYYWGSATGVVADSTETLDTNMQALDKIMKASIMTNTGYEDTIKGVYSILTQFYHGAISEAGNVTEKLFFVTQKTALEFNDLIQSFKMVGPVAAQAGATFDDMVTLLGRLGDLGVRGSMAGRGFRQMFIQMVRPSGPAKKAIDNLFYSISSQADKFGEKYAGFKGKSYMEMMFPKGEFVGTTQYIKNLALAVDTLTQSERAAFLGRISTANELPILTALIADEIKKIHGLADEADKTQNLTTDSATYFQKNWERFSNSWKATVGEVQRAWERIRIVVGALIAKALTPFADKIREIADAVRKWVNDPANGAIIQWLSKLAAGVAVVSAMAGAVLSLMGALAGLGASAYLIVNTFGRYVPMVSAFAVAAGAFIDGLIRNFDVLRNAVGEAMGNIQSATGGGIDIIEALSGAFTAVQAPLRLLMDGVFQLIAAMIKLVGLAGELLGAVGALKPILTVVGGIIGALMVRNILLWAKALVLAKAETLYIKALYAGDMIRKVASFFTGIVTGARAATFSLQGVRAAASAAWAAIGGPIGIISAVIGIGSIAYEVFPPVKDFVDSITSSFNDTNKEAREFMENLGGMGQVVDANFRILAESKYAEAFNKNWKNAFVEVGKQREAYMSGDPESIWAQGFVTIDGKNLPVDVSQDDAFIASRIAEMLTPSADSMQTALTEELKKSLSGINASRLGRGIAAIGGDTFAEYIEHATRILETEAPKGQADFARALSEHVFTGLDPSASRKEIEEAIRAQLLIAWDPETVGKEMGITLADINSTAFRLAGVYYDKASVDAERSAQTTKVWGAYAQSIVDAVMGGASEDEAKAMMTRYFEAHGGKTGGLVGTFAEIFLQLDQETQQAINEALQLKYGTSAESLIGADTAKTLQSMAAEKYTALASAAANAMYEGYQEAEQATQQAYQNTMIGLMTGDLDPALEAVLSLEDTLRNRAISPEAYQAWVSVIDLLVARGMLDLSTAQSIKKQIAPKVEEALLTTAQQVANDIGAIVSDLAPEFQTTFDSMLLTVGQVYRGEFQGKGGLEGAREYFMRAILPNYANADLTDEQRKMIQQYGEALFPDIKFEDLVAPLQSKISKFGNVLGQVLKTGTDLLAKIYAKYSASGVTSMLTAAIEQGQTIANNSNPAFQAGYTAIEAFAQSMALGTEAGYRQAIDIYNGALQPLMAQLPEAIQEQLKSGLNVAGGALGIDMSGTTLTVENAEKTRREWAQDIVGATFPSHKDIMKAIRDAPTNKEVIKGASGILTDKGIWKGLTGSTGTRTVAKGFIDDQVNNLTALYNSSDPKTQRKIKRMVNTILDTKNLPTYIRTALEGAFTTGMTGVEIVPPEGEEKKTNWLDTIIKGAGIGAGTETTEKKPAQVWLAVHMKAGKSVDRTVEKVEGAYTALNGFMTHISGMPWEAAGIAAGGSLAGGFLKGLNPAKFQTVAWGIRKVFRDVTWYSGGQVSGGSWARGFNDAVQSTIKKTLTFVASVTIGQSPPPAGPLSDIDKGGANAGFAWASGFGNAAREEMLRNAAEMRNQNLGERMGLVTEEKYDAKKTIDIHLDVTSKDGSVDRAKQGEFRRGMMDVLVAADLEHYVTVS